MHGRHPDTKRHDMLKATRAMSHAILFPYLDKQIHRSSQIFCKIHTGQLTLLSDEAADAAAEAEEAAELAAVAAALAPATDAAEAAAEAVLAAAEAAAAADAAPGVPADNAS